VRKQIAEKWIHELLIFVRSKLSDRNSDYLGLPVMTSWHVAAQPPGRPVVALPLPYVSSDRSMPRPTRRPGTLQIDPGVSLLAWPVDVPEALSSSERGLSFPHAAVSLLG
jgi:hypothetical protein